MVGPDVDVCVDFRLVGCGAVDCVCRAEVEVLGFGFLEKGGKW